MDELPFKYNLVDGLIVSPFVSQQRVDNMKTTFHPENDDVFVVTYPKSGTTWMQQIVRLILNEGKEDGLDVNNSVPWLEALDPQCHYWIDTDQMPSPRAFKTHLPYSMTPGGLPHTTSAKYIYIARNPKDVIVSIFYHLSRLQIFHFCGTLNDIIRLFLEGKLNFGSWFDHVLEWWMHRNDSNILFLKYEDVKQDLRGTTKTVAKFMEHSLKPEIIDEIVKQSTFESMRVNPTVNFFSEYQYPNATTSFVRKGIVGDWKNHFTPEQNAEFDRVYAEKMKGSGLDFNFMY